MSDIKWAKGKFPGDFISYSWIASLCTEEDKRIWLELQELKTEINTSPYEGLKFVALSLKYAQRKGGEKDEPEGVRYIQISDTLANKLIRLIELYIATEEGKKATSKARKT